MDEPQAADEYDRAGADVLAPAHHAVVHALSALTPREGRLVDLGSGSGRLLTKLARARPDLRITGIEGSPAMLDLGRRQIADAGLAHAVELVEGDITRLADDALSQATLVSCVLTLHHLPPEGARRCLRSVARAPGGFFLFDFARLRRDDTWPALLSFLEPEGAIFERDAVLSERAAYSARELAELAAEAGLSDFEHATTRPLPILQAIWRGAGVPGVPARTTSDPIPRQAALQARLLAGTMGLPGPRTSGAGS